MGKKPHTLDDCHKAAIDRDGRCLSLSYKNVETKMKWECAEKHQWETSFHAILHHTWCPHCCGKIKLTIEDCNALANNKGGLCLEKEYINNKTKMKWECSSGHQWATTFGSIRNGQWCKRCAGLSKLTIEDCIDFAAARGGWCLSTIYDNTQTKMLWKCELGHEWWAVFGSLRNSSSWCPHCAGIARLTLSDCEKYAQSKGGNCLSSEYINAGTKMTWQCACGHIWMARFHDIKDDNNWCPECSVGKTQKQLQSICEDLLGISALFNYRGFDWLKTIKSGKQEIDIWFPQIKLAIEYDGKQHYEPVERFGGEEEFRLTKQRDTIKNTKIAEHPEDVSTFIRFSYKDNIAIESARAKLLISGIKCRGQQCA
jgi:hypothetical protein